MSINELDKRLADAADSFATDVKLNLQHSSCDSDTKYELEEIARQMFYALRDYKNAIIEYERSK